MPRNVSLTSLFLAQHLHPKHKSVRRQNPICARRKSPRTASIHERFRAPRPSDPRPTTSTSDCLHFAIHTLGLTPDHFQSKS